MNSKEIDNRMLEEILLDVAPKVEEATGWDTGLAGLTLDLIRPDQIWEKAVLPVYKSLDIKLTPRTAKGQKEIEELKKPSYYTFGFYIPPTNTILLIPENLGPETNLEGIAILLAHELTHRCQYLNKPKFTQKHDKLFKKITETIFYLNIAYNKPSDETIKTEMDELIFNTEMALIEGDARLIEEQLKNKYYPKAQLILNYQSDLRRNQKEEEFIIAQLSLYDRGKIFMKKMYNSRGREGVNAVYDLDPINLYMTFHSWV